MVGQDGRQLNLRLCLRAHAAPTVPRCVSLMYLMHLMVGPRTPANRQETESTTSTSMAANAPNKHLRQHNITLPAQNPDMDVPISPPAWPPMCPGATTRASASCIQVQKQRLVHGCKLRGSHPSAAAQPYTTHQSCCCTLPKSRTPALTCPMVDTRVVLAPSELPAANPSRLTATRKSITALVAAMLTAVASEQH